MRCDCHVQISIARPSTDHPTGGSMRGLSCRTCIETEPRMRSVHHLADGRTKRRDAIPLDGLYEGAVGVLLRREALPPFRAAARHVDDRQLPGILRSHESIDNHIYRLTVVGERAG
jgi:hypothetical protein